MNLDIFKPNDKDGAFLAYIKREASFHIEQIRESPTKEYWYEYYKALMELVIASKNSNAKNPYEFVSHIIESKDYLKYNIPLLPINITKEDFEIVDNQILWNHKRSLNLIWNSTHNLNDENSIYYRHAYKLQIRKTFDFIKKEVIETDYIQSQYVIFISKGGIVNGDFIDFAYIRTKDYEKGSLRLDLPITIPVCEVFFIDKDDNKSMIYVVDHREPKLKELMEKYSCPICNNTNIASYKLNLRNCKTGNIIINYKKVVFNKPEVKQKNDYDCLKVSDNHYQLKCKLGVIAEWINGTIILYESKFRYKRFDKNYIYYFTGFTLSYLKLLIKNNNPNITVV